MTSYDVAVIGGGPAGMMAAGRAAERGLRVVLVEKNPTLGKKLLITGGGRCNVTNAETDLRTLLAKFRGSDKYLFSAFAQRGVAETLEFFHSRGMPTKIEAEKRVFPVSDSAQSVWNVLAEYLKSGAVTVISSAPAAGFDYDADAKKIAALLLKDGRRIEARSYIAATGGMSRPDTGSTGDGFDWLGRLGHAIASPAASLVPITVEDAWAKKLAGIALRDIKISLFLDGIKQRLGSGRSSRTSAAGKILFTHVGLSGPAILNLSAQIRELLAYGTTEVSLDLLPRHDYATLNAALQEAFKREINKKIKNGLDGLIPAALVSAILERARIDGDTPCHSITREERLALVAVLKDLRLRVTGLLGVEKAIITSGGVALDEIDFKTMRSRLISNLHIVGDLLDIDRPSGGYSLQLCWTTGYVAGNSVNAPAASETGLSA